MAKNKAFISLLPHQFFHVKFRKMNICFDFSTGTGCRKQQNIQFSKFDMDKLMSYQGYKTQNQE